MPPLPPPSHMPPASPILPAELPMPPATPDIGRKPPFQSANESAPASTDVDKDSIISYASPSTRAEKVGGEEDSAAASTQASYAESPNKIDLAPLGDIAAIVDPGIATPAGREGYTPLRRWKKSTKGMVRLKVKKDQFKRTPKTVTPGKKQITTKVDGAEQIRRTRRKLDVDKEPENFSTAKLDSDKEPGSFSTEKLDSDKESGNFRRAKLMDNLRNLARGLCAVMMSNKEKKRKRIGENAIVPYQYASPNHMQLAIVSHVKREKKLQNKVILDDLTLGAWNGLEEWDKKTQEAFEGEDIGSGPEWVARRVFYENLVDRFIHIISKIFGPRKFGRRGGSVIDSVVGTFLTQNVADHLSSNAFMMLEAKFPGNNVHNNAEESSDAPPSLGDCNENSNLNEASHNEEVKGQYGPDYKATMESFMSTMGEKDLSTWDMADLMNLVKDKSGKPIFTEATMNKFIATLRQKDIDTSDWDKLRMDAVLNGYKSTSETRIADKVDWKAVLHASPLEVAKCIEGRGQHNLMACRIQAFLKRIMNDHGSLDLDWLRHVPRERAREYLRSIHGLGEKSVDCIRLLSLEHKAFPVDVNVCRISIRLGWIELQSLPLSQEFHLVSQYPVMQDVQKYLWPRLCTLNKDKLYELHCLMITFGKVICTKVNPNCGACPFRSTCKYYNSPFSRLSLPPAQEHEQHRKQETRSLAVTSLSLPPVAEYEQHRKQEVISEILPLSNDSFTSSSLQTCQHQTEIDRIDERQPVCEPIVEMPPSPSYEHKEAISEQEDHIEDIEDILPEEAMYDGEINLCSKSTVDNGFWTPNSGKDLVLINTMRQTRKLKTIGRLRTVHDAYVLPNTHSILEKFDKTMLDLNRCRYLLLVRSSNDLEVTGTIMIPYNQANGGNFPLNSTYFQDNEVFADYSTMLFPISVSRASLWDLTKCFVYLGSQIQSITADQPIDDIEDCFKKGYICVRAYDRGTGKPMPFCAELHVTNEEKIKGRNRKKGKKSPQLNSDEKAPSTN